MRLFISCLSSPIKWIIGPADLSELWVPWTLRDISVDILSKCECAIFIRSVNYLACGRHTASFYPLKCVIDLKKMNRRLKWTMLHPSSPYTKLAMFYISMQIIIMILEDRENMISAFLFGWIGDLMWFYSSSISSYTKTHIHRDVSHQIPTIFVQDVT